MKTPLPFGLYQLSTHWPFALELPGCQLSQLHFVVDEVTADSFSQAALPEPEGINKRRAEFLAGRYAASQALEALGLPNQFPSRLPDSRQPSWPHGYCGSISHGHGQAAAVVARTGDWLSLGLDLEMQISDARAQRLASTVLLPEEHARFSAAGQSLASALLLAFSAKESLFKALNPLCQTYFGFLDAQLISWQDASLKLQLQRNLGTAFKAGDCFQGQWTAVDGGVLTLVAVPKAD